MLGKKKGARGEADGAGNLGANLMWHSYWSFSASKSGVAAVYPVTSISFLSACLCAEPEGSLYSYSNKCIRSASKDHEHGPDHLTKFDSILHLM